MLLFSEKKSCAHMYIYFIELMDMYLYLRSGMTVKLNEEHVITRCQALNFE